MCEGVNLFIGGIITEGLLGLGGGGAACLCGTPGLELLSEMDRSSHRIQTKGAYFHTTINITVGR